jgi:hypothetical protein
MSEIDNSNKSIEPVNMVLLLPKISPYITEGSIYKTLPKSLQPVILIRRMEKVFWFKVRTQSWIKMQQSQQ